MSSEELVRVLFLAANSQCCCCRTIPFFLKVKHDVTEGVFFGSLVMPFYNENPPHLTFWKVVFKSNGRVTRLKRKIT